MVFQLNFKSAKPIYLQIVDQVKAAIASGSLKEGEALPSIRPLSENLRVNRNTIAKAYSELETQGAIETSMGRGCFVKANNSPLKKEARRDLLVGAIDELVVQAHHLQVSGSELLELVHGRIEALKQRQHSQQLQDAKSP